MSETQVSESQPNFTKGEKCILAHLVLTIGGSIVLLIIYLVHIFNIKHSESTGAFDTRRTLSQKDYSSLQVPIGLLYVNATIVRNICNTLLISQGWSISTGHCIAMRSDPDLSHLLYEWRLKYPYNNATLKIIRSIVHPHFKRDTFANNVGLIQHNPVKEYERYKVPKIYENRFNDIEENKLAILSWDHGSFGYKG
ncbi:uncharacterized protein LOC120636355 [Pararge aegeria]|uniref:uncharacterized protein LOC120636355 n=1 Tax=Pararge aegeria TaxID=116150 RepID=UPI0019D23D9B|nr:uncharacterized protein LOC120636355 [Pararge aegeria]